MGTWKHRVIEHHADTNEVTCATCGRVRAVWSGKRWSCYISRNGAGSLNRPYYERHGLSKERYQELLEIQDGRCAICRDSWADTPYIDHDHNCCNKPRSCGQCVRGLLCNNCNTALGMFKDDIGTLQSAVAYLQGERPRVFVAPTVE